MDYYAIVGMLAIGLMAIFGGVASIRKMIEDSRRPMDELNINVVKLNAHFENMREKDEVRDKRIDKHGAEIDSIIEKQRLNEKELAQIKMRVDALEKR